MFLRECVFVNGWSYSVTTGVPHLITADMVKEGAAVIDVGINRMQEPVTGKLRLVGDVDFEGKRGTTALAFLQWYWFSVILVLF